MMSNEITRCQELTDLCAVVRDLVTREEYEKCNDMICKAMSVYPDAPQPHNLLGVVLEMTGNHVSAMKHFRAAWALDPTYAPANQNLTTYGTFYSSGRIAFDECDCQRTKAPVCTIEYDAHGIGHVIRRK